MRIEWLPTAQRNRDSQIACIAEHSPSAAIDVGDAIEAALRRLADHPEIGALDASRGRANWW